MSPHPVPHDGDVVVRQDRLQGELVYVLYAAPGPDQFFVRTREDAVAKAAAFAQRARVGAWFTDGGATFVPLVSPRIASSEGTRMTIPGHRARPRVMERRASL